MSIGDNAVAQQDPSNPIINVFEEIKEFDGIGQIKIYGIKFTNCTTGEDLFEYDDISFDKDFVVGLAKTLQQENVEIDTALYVIEDAIADYHTKKF